MRRRTLINGAVVSTVLLTAIGVGVAVASAATTTPSATTSASASADPSPTVSTTVSTRPTGSASASASASSSTSSDGSVCADVFLVAKPAGDTVGKLCTAVTASGTSISGVTVTFTASSSCSGSVMLRVSGIDKNKAEFGVVKTVTCSSDKATASFDPVTTGISGTEICGTLLSDTYTAALACVPITSS